MKFFKFFMIGLPMLASILFFEFTVLAGWIKREWMFDLKDANMLALQTLVVFILVFVGTSLVRLLYVYHKEFEFEYLMGRSRAPKYDEPKELLQMEVDSRLKDASSNPRQFWREYKLFKLFGFKLHPKREDYM